MPMYSHDIAHCSNKECKLYDRCYRAWLAENMLSHGWETGWFVKPDKTGKECGYFLDVKDY